MTTVSSKVTRAEIASQPLLWREALARSDAGVPGLPTPSERILLLGCGTSYYVGMAYAVLREHARHGATDAAVASEFEAGVRRYHRVLAISRSGRSSELLDAIGLARGAMPGIRVTAVLGEQHTPLAAIADDVIDMSFADERSIVQTRFPTTTLVLLRSSLSPTSRGECDQLPELAESSLRAPLPATDIRQLVVLGSGWGVAIAEEAALKVRESAGVWVESYPVGEYRHGPVATCGPGSLVWGLDELPADIVETVTGTGGRVVHGCGEPLAELVRLHRFAIAMAEAKGRDADAPALLSRAVVL